MFSLSMNRSADLEIGAPSSRFMVPMRGIKVAMALHEPWLVWSPAFRKLERLGPAEAGTPSCQRFMVPMRDKKGVRPTHEPERRAPARRGVACPECADPEIGAPSLRFIALIRVPIHLRPSRH